jgi:3-methyladenine DNA glycosylase/8-oxoguanine DNA glycosylase
MRTARPFEACVAAVLEQKVTGHEAWQSWRVILKRFGEPAPGPTEATMRVPPPAREWRAIDTWEYRRAGVTPQRIRTLQTVASAAGAIEAITALSTREADQRLRALPGVGVWTSAEVRQRALGDSDAVSFGDFHIGRDVCWWLTGETGDDEKMRILLEPYQGHRYRVQRLMEMCGGGMPRRGPRLAPQVHRSW